MSKEQRMLDVKELFVGKEPSFKNVPYDSLKNDLSTVISRTLNWYSINRNSEDSLKWLQKKFPEENFKSASNIGFLCRMIEQGFPKDLIEDRINEEIKNLPRIKGKENQPKEEKKKLVGPTDAFGRPLDLAVDAVLEKIDYLVDDIITGKTVVTRISYSGLKPKQLKDIIEHINKYINEFDGCSKKEEYSFGKRLENALISNLKKILSDIEKIAPEKTKTTRKKKEIPVEKIVKNFTTGSFEEFKSLPPESLLTATQALLFDSRYRKIILLFAEKGKTLGIKGKSVLNIDEGMSIMKTLRKPVEQIKEILNGHKTTVSKRLAEIKSVANPAKFRASEGLLIIKTWQ